MQAAIYPTAMTIMQQACATVPGFTAMNDRFKKKLSISGKADSTFVNYSRQLAAIALYFNRLPVDLTLNDIEDYLYHLKVKYIIPSETVFKHTVYSLRFIFRMYDQEYRSIQLPAIKRGKTLPVVLSKAEVVEMLNKTKKLKHRLLIALLYGCGLRCAEVHNVRLNDLDFQRSMLHVRQGKGKKDRYVPLGDFLINALKHYINIYQPRKWLFDGMNQKTKRLDFDKNYSRRSIQWAVRKAAQLAGIKKHVTVHTLRHTFATHLLEDGLDIVSIKELLGHARVETTLIYLHVAQFEHKRKASPIDSLQGVKIMDGMQYKIEFLEN